MFRGKGFTMVELIIVIIIIGLLITLGLPQYRKMLERGQVARALAVLDMIRKAQSIVHASTNTYSGNLAANGDLDNELDGALRPAIDALNGWDFSIEDVDATEFTAVAERDGGYCDGGRILLNHNGQITPENVFAAGRCANMIQQ
ncbi:MAG: prepilin-type N-terminal cleavage/methylation domain-containing protein [Candidatus Omnitrophota bacterium]